MAKRRRRKSAARRLGPVRNHLRGARRASAAGDITGYLYHLSRIAKLRPQTQEHVLRGTPRGVRWDLVRMMRAA